MDARPLIIGPPERALIAEAIRRAAESPVPLDVTLRFGVGDEISELRLADRPKSFYRPPSHGVELQLGYRIAVSFERQPSGLVRHVSISVDTPGKLPSIPAIEWIAKEFGFKNFPILLGKIWLEEFEPGHFAVNLAELTD